MDLPAIPDIAVISPLVTRILGQNAGPFTLQGTNTYLVGSSKTSKRVLIDTGAGMPSYSNLLCKYLMTTGLQICAILITHNHRDHIGGLKILRDKLGKIPVYKYPRLHDRGDGLTDPADIIALRDNEVLNTAGVSLQAIFTPGHTIDHCNYWLKDENALFTGDHVLGHGTTVFERFDEYMTSLDRIKSLNPARLYPGHGQIIEEGIKRINEVSEMRRQRLMQVLDQVRAANNPITIDAITAALYKDLPATKLQAAKKGVKVYLDGLEQCGLVICDDSNYRTVCSRL